MVVEVAVVVIAGVLVSVVYFWVVAIAVAVMVIVVFARRVAEVALCRRWDLPIEISCAGSHSDGIAEVGVAEVLRVLRGGGSWMSPWKSNSRGCVCV